MTVAMEPYPEYSDSSVGWIGLVPSNWRVLRAKYVFQEVDRRSITGSEELLSVSHITGVTPRSQKNVTMFLAESNVGHKQCEPGDLVINTMWAWMGALGMSEYSGLVSPSYGVYRPNGANTLLARYADYLLRTPVYVAEYTRRSTGVNSSRLRLYPDQFLRVPLLIPPQEEQAAIVRYLDWTNARLERAIRTKRRIITLLNEQKRGIIHRAVKRGLDPNVRLRPSNVPWLGEIPAHWSLSRVKNEFKCLNPRRVPLSSVERGKMTDKLFDYYGASGIIDKVEDYIFDDAALLLAEDGANLVLRNLPLAIIARGKFWVNNHAHILKPVRGNLDYLAAYMETLHYQPWISGAAQPKLTKERLMSIAIAVAPAHEQDAIVAEYNHQVAPLESAINHTNREIALICEYRTRVIADVVTGKLDVRKAAMRLPVEEIPAEEDLSSAGEIPDDEVMEQEG